MITRFAPSPTGLLHLGHAYAALRAWLAAEHTRSVEPAEFVLRIEDLDRARCRPEFVQAIFEDLHWLGLRWREPVLHQSTRTEAYGEALSVLAARGLIYPCFCTRTGIASARDADRIAADIALAGEAPHPSISAAPVYPGTCRQLSTIERQQRLARGDAHAWRLDAARAAQEPEGRQLEFIEEGETRADQAACIEVQPQLLGDIVLARKDLPAAYQLAVVVDDAFQHITLVTRGEDLQPATHVQRLLQALLALPTPRYAHHRLILDAQGRKFSKRDLSPTLRALRAEGCTPTALRERLGLA